MLSSPNIMTRPPRFASTKCKETHILLERIDSKHKLLVTAEHMNTLVVCRIVVRFFVFSPKSDFVMIASASLCRFNYPLGRCNVLLPGCHRIWEVPPGAEGLSALQVY